MDPDEALKNARHALKSFLAAREAERDHMALQEADQLAASFEALDDWLRKGGFVPYAWNEAAPRI